MMNKIDLHMHSTNSDGEFTPKELINLAIQKGIKCISITDHDIATANKEAKDYAKEKGIDYINGIEITITPPRNTKELHIVGLFIDFNNEEIKKIAGKHREYTLETTQKIISKLNKLGYEIDINELLESSGGKFGRPFIADLILSKYPERFRDKASIFNELLGKEGKAFVRAKGTGMEEAIKIIHNAGGIAILAHPWYLGENIMSILNNFVKFGGDGLELDHANKSTIPMNMQELLEKFVKDHNLVISGGTDFHCIKDNGKSIGDYGITELELEKLKEYHLCRKNF